MWLIWIKDTCFYLHCIWYFYLTYQIHIQNCKIKFYIILKGLKIYLPKYILIGMLLIQVGESTLSNILFILLKIFIRFYIEQQMTWRKLRMDFSFLFSHIPFCFSNLFSLIFIIILAMTRQWDSDDGPTHLK